MNNSAQGNQFSIGYGNFSNVEKNGDNLSIELYYGGLRFDLEFVKNVLLIRNWGHNEFLSGIDADQGVDMWFDGKGNLLDTFNAYDSDGCGIMRNA